MTKIFVFGSNLAGRHGAGAARYAMDHHGAEYGVGMGPTGMSYALPTKDRQLNTLPLNQIELYIAEFLKYAEAQPDNEFMLTPIGCGLAGYRRDQIKPLIENNNRPSNVIYTKEWEDEAMSNLINNIYHKIYNTKIIRKPKASFSVEGPEAEPKNIVTEYLEVKLIVMSYDTHVEVMKNDYRGVTGMSLRQDKSQPYRMFGIRVAFDDSLPLGEVLVTGDVL